MKIVVVSDSHRNTEILDQIAKSTNADLYLHAGDSCLPEPLIRPFLSVRGNCDSYPYEMNRTITLGGVKLYITHGHFMSKRRIVRNARMNNCLIAIYGHTHISSIEKIEDIYLINPGSVAYPRGKTKSSYIEINYTDENDIDIKIVELE